MDFSGCGNSLNVRHPQMLKLIMDSLRYWVTEMHVDGFRFDLASALARELYEVDSLLAFFDIIHQDPTLADVKLIAEPWDLGDGGYQVGQFPLLLMGDEMERTQKGNNNGFCQDNELTWLNWELTDKHGEFLDFTRQLIYFRREHPVFRQSDWFQGRAIHGEGATKASAWFNPDGEEMTEEQWQCGFAQALTVFLNGQEIANIGSKGERIIDDSFLLFFNAHYEMMEFTLPPGLQDKEWAVVLDTKEPGFAKLGSFFTDGKTVPVTERSLVVLRCMG